MNWFIYPRDNPEGISDPTKLLRYYQNDALGSTRLVTASTGAILYSSDYEPFGTSFNPSGSFIPDYQYTGKIVDYSSTDLYYYGSRFYDPSLDRFITEDTSKGNPEDPLSLNRYIYARDNPEKYVDPSGNMFIFSNSGAGGIGSASFIQNGNVNGPFSTWTNQWSSSYVYLPKTRRPFNGNPFLQKYGPAAPSTTISETTSSGNPMGSQAWAILVPLGFFGVGIGLAILTPFAIATTGPGGLVVGAGAIGAFYGGADSAYYDYTEGGNATPKGAFDAGASGVVEFIQGAMDLFGF